MCWTPSVVQHTLHRTNAITVSSVLFGSLFDFPSIFTYDNSSFDTLTNIIEWYSCGEIVKKKPSTSVCFGGVWSIVYTVYVIFLVSEDRSKANETLNCSVSIHIWNRKTQTDDKYKLKWIYCEHTSHRLKTTILNHREKKSIQRIVTVRCWYFEWVRQAKNHYFRIVFLQPIFRGENWCFLHMLLRSRGWWA